MSRNGEYMALYNLNRIQDNASNMQSLMVQNDTLPEWAKSKLTQSRSHLSNVADYKRSKPLGSFYRIYNQLGSPGSHRTFNAAPGQNHHHAKHLGATNKGAYPAVAFLAGSIALAAIALRNRK